MITIQEIKNKMHLHRINQKQLASALQIDKSTISAHLSGKLKLSRAYKAAYFYYFNINFPENLHQYIVFFRAIEKFYPNFDIANEDIRESVGLLSADISNQFNPIVDIYET